MSTTTMKVGRFIGTPFAIAMLLVGLVACDESPVAPSRGPVALDPAASAPSPAAPTAPPVVVTGRVADGNDGAVAGARVVFGSSRNGTTQSAEAHSDAGGAFTLEIPAGLLRYNSAILDVAKDGYEPSQVYAWLGSTSPEAPVTRNVRLHEIVRLSPGQSVELEVTSDDSVCGADLEDYYCRRIRVVSPGAGHLTVTAHETSFAIKLPGSSSFWSVSLRLAVEAGSETTFDVMLVGGRQGKTTLTTRLDPL